MIARGIAASLLATWFIWMCPNITAAAVVQLTQATGCYSITDESGPRRGLDATAAHLAFTSNCNFGGANPFARPQALLLETATNAITRLANSPDNCFSVAGPISSDGKTVAFASDCNLASGNADRNDEMFVFDVASGVATQLTHSANCYNWYVAMSGDGKRVGFHSNCDPTGSNPGHQVQIFTVDTTTQAITQVTKSDGCGGNVPTLNADGSRLAFESSCDLTGGNADHSMEIFLFDATTGTTTQVTSGTYPCLSYWPSIDASGTHLALMSSCDLSGGNADRSWELFLLDTAKSSVQQLTSDVGCGINLPSISAYGTRIAFESGCNKTGDNPAYDYRIYQIDRTASSISMLTKIPGCFNGYPVTNAGGMRVAFMSTCDYTGANADHSDEIFLASTDDPCPTPVPTATLAPTFTRTRTPTRTPTRTRTPTKTRTRTRTPTRTRTVDIDHCGSLADCAARCADDPNRDQCHCLCKNRYCLCTHACLPQQCVNP